MTAFETTLPAGSNSAHLLGFMNQTAREAGKLGLEFVSSAFKTLSDGRFYYKETWGKI